MCYKKVARQRESEEVHVEDRSGILDVRRFCGRRLEWSAGSISLLGSVLMAANEYQTPLCITLSTIVTRPDRSSATPGLFITSAVSPTTPLPSAVPRVAPQSADGAPRGVFMLLSRLPPLPCCVVATLPSPMASDAPGNGGTPAVLISDFGLFGSPAQASPSSLSPVLTVWGLARALWLAGGLLLFGVVGNPPLSDIFDRMVGVAGSGSLGSIAATVRLFVGDVSGVWVGALCAAIVVAETGATRKMLFSGARGTSASGGK